MIYSRKPKDFKNELEIASCFLEYDGKMLLLHRADHLPQGNTWASPAGKIESSETPIQAVIREVLEETSFAILHEKDLLYLGKVYVRYPDLKFVHHMFRLGLDYQPKILLSHEHKDFNWVTPAEALKMDLIPDQDNCIRLFYKLPPSFPRRRESREK